MEGGTDENPTVSHGSPTGVFKTDRDSDAHSHDLEVSDRSTREDSEADDPKAVVDTDVTQTLRRSRIVH